MIIVYILLLTLLLIWFYYSELNTFKVKIGGKAYNVHGGFNDKEKAAELLNEVDRRIGILKQYLEKKYGCATCNAVIYQFNMHERTKQLERNYVYTNLYEISPNNLLGNTSFTESKGKKIVFCLRDKDGKLHDINTVMFVALHEITHVMNDRWGHEEYFWDLFEIILHDAADAGIYKPQNYYNYPVNYCGIKIGSNPYFDKL